MKPWNGSGEAKSANVGIIATAHSPAASEQSWPALDRDGGGGYVALDKATIGLPFLCVLTTTPQVSETLGKRHKTVGMWVQQMVSIVRRWLPNVPIKLDAPISSALPNAF
jgi:hypothetical protein